MGAISASKTFVNSSPCVRPSKEIFADFYAANFEK
jgi:hypothetical protein